MQINKLFQLFLLTVFAVTVVLTLTIISVSIQTIQAAPPLDETSQYEEIYEVLKDGSIVVTRTRVLPTQIQVTQVCTQPAPNLLEPANGAQLDTLTPDYLWEQVSAEVFRYRFNLSRVPDFSVIDEDVIFRTSSPSPGSPMRGFSRSNLISDTTYYWRVASRCEESGEEGPFSAPFSFRTAPPGGVILPAPNQLTPEDGAVVGSTRVTFGLEEVSGTLKYQFRYYNSPTDDWDDWFRLQISQDPLATSTFDPQETLYWRGAAQNSYAVGTPSVRRSFTTPPVTATTEINPSTGGTLTPDPGNISVQFPPDAVSAQTTLSYTLQPEPERELANFRFGGRAFTLEAFDANGAVTTFNQPFTITIVYDSWDLFAADIGDPTRLNLVFWNGSEWEEILPCAGCSIDTVNLKVTVVLDHLTEFALVGPDETKVYLPIVIK
jgi:hypothetical protein